MYIDPKYFIFINVAIAVVYITVSFDSFKNGLLLQLISTVYSLLCCFVAYLIGPILANKFPLIQLDSQYEFLNLNSLLNTILFYIIVFVVLRFLYFLIKPLFKSVSKIPIIGAVNRIGGLLLGLVNSTIILVIISFILTTPIFSNGQEIKENTYFKYSDVITSKVLDVLLENIDTEKLANDINDFNFDETRNEIILWMEEQGLLNE